MAGDTQPSLPEKIPAHVAIIMDGNGRWAERRRRPRLEGHAAGIENTRSVVRCLGEYGIKYVSLYSFSTENWNRPEEEVTGLMDMLGRSLEKETNELHKENVRIRHLGRLERLPENLSLAIQWATELTKGNTGMSLSLAFDYGGRAEIVDAVRHIINARIPAPVVDERAFSLYLYTADLPDVDLVVRTGGEIRISNFLLWQSAYAEYYFSDVLWPDFGPGEVTKALVDYSKRQRRFGKL
jgi:undecaprenyl diphosphate synthase